MNRAAKGLIVGCMGFLMGACSSGVQNIKFRSPEKATLRMLESGESIQLPGVKQLEEGEYRVTLLVPDGYAKKLDVGKGFVLYGFLNVGEPTANSKMTNVLLDIPDDLLSKAKKDGKVVFARTFDEEAGDQTLVSIKLGEVQPW